MTWSATARTEDVWPLEGATGAGVQPASTMAAATIAMVTVRMAAVRNFISPPGSVLTYIRSATIDVLEVLFRRLRYRLALALFFSTQADVGPRRGHLGLPHELEVAFQTLGG